MKKTKKLLLKDYQKLCKKTAGKFGSKEKEIFTYGLGIAGEAGDVAGCIKKIYSHKDDQRMGVKENLGDTIWYIAMICNFYNWDLEEVMRENIKKLEKRYKGKGFSFRKAKRGNVRVDWNEK